MSLISKGSDGGLDKQGKLRTTSFVTTKAFEGCFFFEEYNDSGGVCVRWRLDIKRVTALYRLVT